MQTMKSRISSRLLFAATILIVALGGCGNDRASDSGRTQPDNAVEARDNFELVVVHRPISVENYVNLLKMGYKMCKMAALSKNLPVKPFPETPKNFVRTRLTTISDGKFFLQKEENFGVDFDGATPENGCETKFDVGSSTWVIPDPSEVTIGHRKNEDSSRDRASSEVQPYDDKAASGYPVSKTINNIALKCTDDQNLMVAGKVVAEMCILDPKLGRIALPDGRPIIVYSRDLPGKTVFGSPMLFEPISLKVGIKVNPEIFANTGDK